MPNELLENAYDDLGYYESWKGELLKEGRITRNGAKITQEEFERVISDHHMLEFPGVHCRYDELTGEPIHESEENVVYLIGEKNELGKIDYGYGWIGLTNVPKKICIYLVEALNAKLLPIYYNG